MLDHPRYRAMERFFDREGPWGRTMMRRTASLQINLDSGDDSDGVTGYRSRWTLAHRIGPVLVAAFANSPLRGGRPTGWVSTRQANWGRMDPGRTRRPATTTRTPRGMGALRARRAGAVRAGRIAGARAPATSTARCASAGGTGPATRDGIRRLGGSRQEHADWTAPPGLTFRRWLRGAPGSGRRPSATWTTTSARSSRRSARAAGWSCG